jgi:predicted nucleic acid-binding protein
MSQPVVLDACVLANMGVCDLLLRLAESPPAFAPRWSEQILEETMRVQVERFGWPQDLADYWRSEVLRHFSEATVRELDSLLPRLTNHEKDRHVLAAAIEGGAKVIVTFNLKDFPATALDPWQIRAVHPQDFLLDLYRENPVSIIGRIESIARKHKSEMQDVIIHLGRTLPAFAAKLLQDLGD